MKKIVFVFAFLLTISFQINAQWFWQNPLPQGNFLSDITFIDSLNGYAAGIYGTIVKTVDGGNNWINIKTSIEESLKKISFTNVQNGWIMTYYNSLLYKTSDAGFSWQSMGEIANSYLNDFEMVTDSIGYACGPDSKILKTTNGGTSWNLNVTPFYVPGLYAIDFIDENLGFCGGTSTYIFKTTTGGNNWIEQTLPVSPFDFSIFCIKFRSSIFGYIGGYEDDHGIILITTNGGNSWVRSILGNSIQQIYFENLDLGWARTGDGTIYTTLDGGVNWTPSFRNSERFYFFNKNNSWAINLNNIVFSNNGWQTSIKQTKSITNNYLNSVYIKDTNVVYVCGKENVINTVDGGKSWNIIYSNNSRNLNEVKIKGESEIWAVGDSGLIINSTDTGTTWNENYVSAHWLNDFCFIDSVNGYIIGSENGIGKLLTTEDGGKSWSTSNTIPPANDLNKIKFSNDITIWIATNNGFYKRENRDTTWILVKPGNFLTFDLFNNSLWLASSNYIMMSLDLGLTWDEIKVYELTNSVSFIQSISFINENHGWICVEDGRIFRTNDGGLNWNEDPRIAGIGLYSMDFYNFHVGWCVGNGGSVLKFDDSINDIESNTNNIQPLNLLLQQNYPNPFNPSTKISWQSPVGSWQTLKVFDILGNEVATLVNEYRNAGSYNEEFTMNNVQLSTGVYFYHLQVGDFNETKKMILLK